MQVFLAHLLFAAGFGLAGPSGVPRQGAPEPAFFAGSGASDSVLALAVYEGELYAGGEFTTIGGAVAHHVARWTGSAWEALGAGVGAGVGGGGATFVSSMAVLDGALYAGGCFDLAGGVPAHNVARWDGESWSPSSIGPGMDDWVLALAVHDGELFAGGLFTRADGKPAPHVARLRTRPVPEWEPVGRGIEGPVLALASADLGRSPELFAGGAFTVAGDRPARNVACWREGTGWRAVGSGDANGVGDTVQALAVSDVGGSLALYAGGRFTEAGGRPAARVARWSGSTWSSVPATGLEGLGAEAPDNVRTLAHADGVLYAGGLLTRVGRRRAHGLAGAQRSLIACWNGATWEAVGDADGPVRAIRAAGGALFAGGHFTEIDGRPASRVALLQAGEWHPPAPGGSALSHPVRALGLDGIEEDRPALVAGGDFATAGDLLAGRAAVWDGSAWRRLCGGRGFDGPVLAFAAGDAFGARGALYAAGSFTRPALRVARCAGGLWSELEGGGLDGTVRALVLASFERGSHLYAGGDFTRAAATGAELDHVARWDGACWSALPGGGTDAAVRAFALHEGSLYAGGDFHEAGGRPASCVARWDEREGWAPAGGGLEGEVHALVAHEGHLYAGGAFQGAFEGVPGRRLRPQHLARWDGETWSAVEGGADDLVLALASDRAAGRLYVGGCFTEVGAPRIRAARLAAWSRSQGWRRVADANAPVLALCLRDGELFAGGCFTAVDGQASGYLFALGAQR